MPLEQITDDYEVSEGTGEFEKLPDGEYQVESVEILPKSIDQTTKRPILVPTDWGTMQLYLALIKGDTEVPVYCSLNELPFLVLAFGGKLSGLPRPTPQLNQLEKVEEYILTAVELANSGTKRPTIKTKNGWGTIWRLSGAQLPQEDYHFKIVDMGPKGDDGIPCPKENTMYGGENFNMTLEVLADAYGKPSLFNGNNFFWNFVGYKFWARQSERGVLELDYVRGKDGRITPSSKAFALFMQKACPSFFAEGSNVANPNNALPELLKAALEAGAVFRAPIKNTSKGFPYVDMTTVRFVANPEEVIEGYGVDGYDDTPPPEVPSVDDSPLLDDDIPVLKFFVDIFNVLAPNTFEPIDPDKPAVYTSEQKGVLKKYLTPHADKFTARNPMQWVTEDLETLFGVLPYNDLEISQVSALEGLKDKIDSMSIPF